MDLELRLDLDDQHTRFMFGLPDLPAPIDYRSREIGTQRLLIVEDDLDIARFVQRIFEHHGFDVDQLLGTITL
jgi:hypothetical protein